MVVVQGNTEETYKRPKGPNFCPPLYVTWWIDVTDAVIFLLGIFVTRIGINKIIFSLQNRNQRFVIDKNIMKVVT